MDDFENIFELAGYAVTEALDDLRRGYEPQEVVFFLNGDEAAGDRAAEQIHFSVSIEADLAIMRENWGCATMGVMIRPVQDATTGQRALYTWAFGYANDAEAQFVLSYIHDADGVLVHDLNSAIKVASVTESEVYAQVAVLDFLSGATSHPEAASIWTDGNIEALRENIRSA
jgi:hypothetical protein